MPPRVAVTLAAVLNFVGAFLSLAVAATIASGHRRRRPDHAGDRVRRPDRRDRLEPRDVVLRAAVVVVARADRRRRRRGASPPRAPSAVLGDGHRREGRSCPALVAPVLAFVVAGLGDPRSPTGSSAAAARAPVDARLPARPDRVRQPVLALPRHQRRPEDDGHHLPRAGRQREPRPRATTCRPGWSSSSATAIALGTYVGGWRIIRTMGSRIIKMDPAQGFAAQSAGAAVILSASHVGFPLSTTHVISGAIMGAGAAKRLSAVRWGVAGNIVDRVGADAARRRRPSAPSTYGGRRACSATGAAGPVVVSSALLLALSVRVRAPPGGRPDADGGGLSVLARRRLARLTRRGDLGVAGRRRSCATVLFSLVIFGGSRAGEARATATAAGAVLRRARRARAGRVRRRRRVRRHGHALQGLSRSRVLDRPEHPGGRRRRRSSAAAGRS